MNATAHILAAADRCVMCGLCLPHCPTYQLHHRETESPRGRIALMQALAAGRLQADEALQRHLDSCLVCRACERMCPSKVEYGQLIDTTRGLLRARGQQPGAALRQLLDQVADKPKLQRNATLLRGYQRSGVQSLLRASGLLKGLGLAAQEASLPAIPEPARLAEHYPAKGACRGRIGLFTGCIGSVLEGELHRAAIALLTRLGYEVLVPAAQVCCGSLHQHNGAPQRAHELTQQNAATFAALKLDAVVSTVSGCAGQLAEHAAHTGTDKELFYYEICDFLARINWPESLPLKPLPQRVLLHLPCSQRNVLQRPEAVPQLLGRIPQLECEELAENALCCGAAGSYQLTQPDNAAALGARKLDHLEESGATLLVSNNLGCALHLRQGLAARGMAVEVVHPLQLLQRALP